MLASNMLLHEMLMAHNETFANYEHHISLITSNNIILSHILK